MLSPIILGQPKTTWEKEASRAVTYHIQLLISSLDIHSHILNIVIDPIQHRALIYNHILQFFEYLRQFDDSACDLVNFALALGDGCVIGVESFSGLLGGLEHGVGE